MQMLDKIIMHKFPGRGQKKTPSATIDNIMHIIAHAIRGPAANVFNTSARTALIGLIGGDLQLGRQVMENRLAQDQLRESGSTCIARCFGELVEVGHSFAYDTPDSFSKKIETVMLQNDHSGFIYFAETSCFPGLVKIGRTTNDPRARLATMDTSLPYSSMKLIMKISVLCIELCEKAVHRFFKNERISANREWFKRDDAQLRKVYVALMDWQSSPYYNLDVMDKYIQ